MSASSSISLLFAVLAGVCFAFLGLAYKFADHYRCRPATFVIPFTLVAGGLSLVSSFTEHSTWGDPRLWWLAVSGGAVLCLAIILLMRTNLIGPASISWTVTNLSLLLPILVFAIFFHERLYASDFISLLLFVVMLFLFGRGVSESGEVKATQAVLFALMLIGIFTMNGTWMVVSKLKEQFFGSANVGAFGALAFFSAAAMAAIIHWRQKGLSPVTPAEWKVGAFAGVSSGVGTLFFLKAMVLPAIVVFPLAQGISLLGGVALTTVLFKEHVNLAKAMGVLVGVLVLLTAVFRDMLAGLMGRM